MGDTGKLSVLPPMFRFGMAFPMPGGHAVCPPYLAALIRLADEIDVAAARNPVLLYDIESLTDEIEIIENKKLLAVRSLEVSETAFTVVTDPSDAFIAEQLRRMTVKMQKTLDDCRAAVNGRTPYTITQSRVLLR